MLYIFDMGGVVTNTSLIEENMCNRMGITVEDFKRFCKKGTSEDLLALYSNGKIGTKEFWNLFEKESGIKVKTDWFHFLFHPVTNTKTVQIINSLKKNGHRVICGTNTNDSYYMNHIERGDYSYFDQTYASNFLGYSKPDKEFFRLILDIEGVKPEDSIFIDDRLENVQAAASLGIKAIQFKTAELLEQELGLV